ncbi:endonuclease/exonuclease/phosphatase family protein [Flavobacterium sp. TP390]|uniref:Endonuclease/exonuclease/phosphatase family protein n=1 Tax=Flavobacterium profundi TaxID=1774945 RepID=A0A6I4IVC5_9FLAO|nr:endonuclease/exonuclease/phosphatase family protein [Flavobacterium profundi]MVO10548.1 endonuclease/exonuclease/phosphatase family protein [Flavobacterium profundi]
MKIKQFLIAFFVLFTISKAFSQDKKFKIHTVAFYNFENLFDTINDPNTIDEEYLPNKGWTYKNYRKKLDNLSRVIIELGTDENPSNSPVVIGACEIENRRVLEDLVKHPTLVNKGYKIIHFDSPDRRGIDVALLYQDKYFTPVSYTNIPLYIYKDGKSTGKKEEKDKEKEEETDDAVQVDESTQRIYTRDQLLVTGYLEGEEISFIVNHWPSRSGGEKKSSPNREAAGALNRKIIDSLYKINPKAKVITMGDLNDDPTNKSVKKGVGAVGTKEELKPLGIYNPMEKMHKQGIGTLGYRDSWNIFDQIMLSEPLVKGDYSTWTYWKANVFKKPYLIQNEGRWKGYPKRNSNGVPGFSDHLPVYIYLIKQVN